MGEDFVNYEIAKELKEKGFPQHITEDAYIIDNYGEDKYQMIIVVPMTEEFGINMKIVLLQELNM